MSRVKLEIDDELDFDLEDGDMIIHIKHDGEIGKVCMPDMDYKVKESLGYKKMLECLDISYLVPVKNLSNTMKQKEKEQCTDA